MRTKIAVLALLTLMLSACSDWWKSPTQPSTTVVQTVTVNTGPGPTPSPSPNDCNLNGAVLGSAGDDFSFTADGQDSVQLVISFYSGAAELPPSCTNQLRVTYTTTGPCTISGDRVTSTTAGSCNVTGHVEQPAVNSNALSLTAVP